MTTMTPELRKAVEQSGDEPVRLVDPETNTTYLLVREDNYILSPIDWTGEISPEEQDALLLEMGKQIGWDDPAMDVYDELDPRKS